MARKSVDDQLRIYTQQMGLVPDQEIAKMAGVSRAVVVNFRQKNNIPAYEGHRHRSEVGEESVAAAEPDPAGAFPVSTTEEDASAFRGRRSALDSYRHLLGRLPDARVAAMAGVTAENVRSYRIRRNIPVWSREGGGEAPDEAPDEALDTAPDTAINAGGAAGDLASEGEERGGAAAEVGAAEETEEGTAEVGAAEETEEGTAEGDEDGGDAEEDLAPVAPLWSAGAISFVATVILPTGVAHRYVVLADDLVQAAQRAVAGVAARHPGAEVRSVERVAPMLDAELA